MSNKLKTKDTMFRALFSDEKNAKELFRALGNELSDDEDFRVITLDYALGDKVENDLAIQAGNRCIVLAEAQATYNPNMPLRMLEYAARTYEMILDKEKIYGSSLVNIPAPELYVLYDGSQKWEDGTILKLSDMYAEQPAENSIEAVVKVINMGYNVGNEVLKKSDVLQEYASLINRIKENRKNGMDEKTAIRFAVREFVAKGSILAEFLILHENEVTDMLGDCTKEEYGQVRYEEGVAETREKDIIDSVKAYKEADMPYEKARALIVKVFNLSEEDADKYMKEYQDMAGDCTKE